MWVFTSDCFVSVVQHRAPGHRDTLIVRGRFRGDAARFLDLPLDAEEVTPAADYRFRCYAHRDEVAAAMARCALGIGYSNFKDSIRFSALKQCAMRIWSVLWRAQAEQLRVIPKRTQLPLALLEDDAAPSFGEQLEVDPHAESLDLAPFPDYDGPTWR